MSIISAGTRLGKYLILNLLGKGGMAEVYLAEHELLQSRVAVKVLPPDLAKDKDMVRRFLREARSAARLRHPHIIRIHDVGVEDGINYFAMDYVSGQSLTQMIAAQGSLDEERIMAVSRQVLSALAEAHDQGIVHRDLKPDNILIDQRGDALVTDFGIARAAGQTRLTSVGSFVGTVHYASPEQARGREISPASDIYSWGVVMYEMATGRTPFTGQETSAVFYQHVHEVPRSPAELGARIGPGLSAVILKSLEKEPEQRYGAGREMLHALEDLDPDARASRLTRLDKAGQDSNQLQRRARAEGLLKEAAEALEAERWASAQALAEKALALENSLTGARELLRRAEKETARDDRIFQVQAQAEAAVSRGYFSEAVQLITELASISRDKQAAVQWLERVQEQAREAAEMEASLQRGGVLEAAGDLEKALELYQGLTETYPDQPLLGEAISRTKARLESRDLCARAKESDQAGDLPQAQELYQQALDKDPSSGKARDGLKEVRSRLSRRQRAEALLAQGRLLLEKGEGHGAVAQFEEAEKLAPDLEGLADGLAQARDLAKSQPPPPAAGATVVASAQPPPSEGTRSRMKLPPPVPTPPAQEKPFPRRGMWIGAAVLVAVIVAVALALFLRPTTGPFYDEPGPKPIPIQPSEDKPDAASLVTQAEKFLAAGDLTQAEQRFRMALKLDPNLSQARHGLDQITLERQRLEQARLLVEKGEEQAQQGRFDQAKSLWLQARQADPNYAPAQAKLAGLEARRAAWQEQQARQERENKARAALDQARAARGEGRWEQAIADFQAYLTVFPNDAAVNKELEAARGEQLKAGSGRLAVEARPDAEVYLDGEPRGKTPLILEGVTAGRHRVEVRAFGAARSKEVEILPRDESRLSFTLTGGSLAINCTPWARVVLDGRPLGQTPIFKRNLVVGPHELLITRQGYQDITRQITLRHGKNTILSFKLQPN